MAILSGMKTSAPLVSKWLRAAIILTWCFLFILLLKRDFFINTLDLAEIQTLAMAKSEEFQSISFKNKKIGYVANKYSPGPNDDWLLEQKAKMNLNVAQSVHTIDLQMKATLSKNNYLKDFTFSFTSPFYQMEAKGVVNSNTVHYTLSTGSNTISDTITFNSPPLLATSRRAYLLTEKLQTGEKRKFPWFDPVSLTGKESVIEYRGIESVLINNRVEKLHKFTESFSGVRVNSWLNDSGVVVKEESPAGFVFLREPKFKALALAEKSEDILAAVAVRIKGSMPSRRDDRMRYRLTLPKESSFDLSGGRQQFSNSILTVSKEVIPEQPGAAACSEMSNLLAASPYIQTTSAEITSLSEEIISDESNTTINTQTIGQWVYDNIAKRPVLGLPDALTTLENRQGDCNEHAALFAAIARAAGIPTKITAGVTYHKEAFYYHAWNEVCIGKSWVSIDTTTNQFPADLTHLRFIEGEMQEQIRIGALLGKLAIEPLPPDHTDKEAVQE